MLVGRKPNANYENKKKSSQVEGEEPKEKAAQQPPLIVSDLPRFMQDLDNEAYEELAFGEGKDRFRNALLANVQSRYLEPKKKLVDEQEQREREMSQSKLSQLGPQRPPFVINTQKSIKQRPQTAKPTQGQGNASSNTNQNILVEQPDENLEESKDEIIVDQDDQKKNIRGNSQSQQSQMQVQKRPLQVLKSSQRAMQQQSSQQDLLDNKLMSKVKSRLFDFLNKKTSEQPQYQPQQPYKQVSLQRLEELSMPKPKRENPHLVNSNGQIDVRNCFSRPKGQKMAMVVYRQKSQESRASSLESVESIESGTEKKQEAIEKEVKNVSQNGNPLKAPRQRLQSAQGRIKATIKAVTAVNRFLNPMPLQPATTQQQLINITKKVTPQQKPDVRIQKKKVTLKKPQSRADMKTLYMPQAQPLEDNTDILDFMSVPESPGLQEQEYQDDCNFFDTSFKAESNPLDTSIQHSILKLQRIEQIIQEYAQRKIENNCLDQSSSSLQYVRELQMTERNKQISFNPSPERIETQNNDDESWFERESVHGGDQAIQMISPPKSEGKVAIIDHHKSMASLSKSPLGINTTISKIGHKNGGNRETTENTNSTQKFKLNHDLNHTQYFSSTASKLQQDVFECNNFELIDDDVSVIDNNNRLETQSIMHTEFDEINQ